MWPNQAYPPYAPNAYNYNQSYAAAARPHVYGQYQFGPPQQSMHGAMHMHEAAMRPMGAMGVAAAHAPSLAPPDAVGGMPFRPPHPHDAYQPPPPTAAAAAYHQTASGVPPPFDARDQNAYDTSHLDGGGGESGASRSPVHVSAGFGSTPKEKGAAATSSKDPEAMRCRVFIGNLNTNQCTQQEVQKICQPYGNVKGISMFRGYAFVQFATKDETDTAINSLNNYKFCGKKLGKFALALFERAPNKSNAFRRSFGGYWARASAAGPVSGPARRPKQDFLFGGQRIRVETANIRNRSFAQEVSGAIGEVEFFDHGKEDTIICGSCRSVFHDVPTYITHRRQKQCGFFECDVAPSSVSCFTCKEEFDESWIFVQHLIHKHSINLYKGQPDSDPVTYMQQEKLRKEAASNAHTAASKTSADSFGAEARSSSEEPANKKHKSTADATHSAHDANNPAAISGAMAKSQVALSEEQQLRLLAEMEAA